MLTVASLAYFIFIRVAYVLHGGQEIPPPFMKPESSLLCSQSSPLNLITTKINLVHILTPSFSKIHFFNIVPCWRYLWGFTVNATELSHNYFITDYNAGITIVTVH
jgi:hypothetical protein